MLTRVLATTALALVLASPTFAQTSSEEPAGAEQGAQTEAADTEQSEQGGAAAQTEQPAAGEAATDEGKQPPGEAVVTEQSEGEVLAAELIGMSLTNPQKEEIGSVSDLIVDDEGKLTGVVVGVGGFLGIGAKKVGVSFDQIEFSPEENIAVVHLSREELENAPDFKTQADIQAEQEAEMQQQMQEQQPATGVPPAE